jgi:hypothetical protein
MMERRHKNPSVSIQSTFVDVMLTWYGNLRRWLSTNVVVLAAQLDYWIA